MTQLAGKTCIVTGASGIVGRAICSTLADQGADVFALYLRHRDPLDALAEQRGERLGRVMPWRCDLSDPEEVSAVLRAILEHAKRVDVLVCCAGQALRRPALLTQRLDAEQLFALNVLGVADLCRQVLRPMLRQNEGRIILIGSRAGTHGMPGQAVYSASKAALHAYAKSLAFEVGEKGITVNAVAPGAIAGGGEGVYTLEDEDRVRQSIGLKRLGQASEIASVVAFLASPAASYVSGAVIPVDGAGRF